MINLVKGDIFQVFDNGYIVEHENKKNTFIAMSDPMVEDGLMCIEVKTC